MTSALPVQPGISSRTLVLCGILSLMLHAGLLAGLSMIQRSEPIIETVSLVNVTLVPTEIPTQTPTPSETPDPNPPPMRTSPRASRSNPISSPTPTVVTQPRPIMKTSALELTPTLPAVDTPTPPLKKRVLKDTLAVDALFAQQATKLVKRTTAADTNPISDVNIPNMRISNVPTKRSLSPTVTAINTAPTASGPTRKRRLTTQLPTTAGAGMAKIGVRHSVQPVYPRVAKEEGWEGVVLLQVLVQTSGIPKQISVRKSSGHPILDKAAVEAMRQWRFAPAMDGNFPVEKYLQVPLKFGLHH